MLHIFLAMNIIAFSLGIVILVLGTLSFRRSGQFPFQIFTLLTAAGITYLLLDIVGLYSRASGGVFGGALPYVNMVLSGAANGLAGFALPALAFQVVNWRVSRARMVLHGAGILALVALGILDYLSPALWPSLANTAALACLQGYGALILLLGFHRIEDNALRGLARYFLIVLLCALPLIVSEHVAAGFPRVPEFLRDFNLAELGYFLALSVLIISYALRYLFTSVSLSSTVLPERFVEKYGISPREREIISMMVQGYGNRRIGETLFISAMTVKNHIYHIYQKTGVANKIQLFNIINLRK